VEFILNPSSATAWSAVQRQNGRSVGFVPTMGALHDGHMSLIVNAKSANKAVACSIFVNPLQFNNAEDLANYPRQLAADRESLERVGCDMVFAPSEIALYANHGVLTYDLNGLDKVMEGASRPGHFQGVVNVVERLFHYVRPNSAYFGEKDRQQLAILRHVANALKWPVDMIGCPTMREPNGLAMSSRNMRLSGEERQRATVLFRALSSIQAASTVASLKAAKHSAIEMILAHPGIKLDYLETVDPLTLQPIMEWDMRNEAIAMIAAYVGKVRLIDNITLRR